MTFALHGTRRVLLVLSLIVSFFVAFSAHAQLAINDDDISVRMDPLVPGAGQQFDLTVSSFIADVNRSRITYRENGVVVAQGIGLKQQSFKAPAIGGKTTISITVETLESGSYTKSIVLRPSHVDLLYEAVNSYVPKGYEGKKLPAHYGGVKVVAMPYFIDDAGRKLDPKSLVYRWYVGDKIQQQSSGYGRDVFYFEGSPFYRTREVRVEVSSVDYEFNTVRSIIIPAFDPVIRFYEVHPTQGLKLEKAINADEPYDLPYETLVEAAPYFFSDIDDESRTTFRWRLNNRPLLTFGDRKQVTLRAPEGETGRARIELKINHENKILQIADAFFNVLFGRSQQSTDNELRTDSSSFQAQ